MKAEEMMPVCANGYTQTSNSKLNDSKIPPGNCFAFEKFHDYGFNEE